MQYANGSRMDGHTVAATATEWRYLGRFATVMDAELLGVVMGWRHTATDSQAAMARIKGLTFNLVRSWIAQRVIQRSRTGSRAVVWVKGHSGEVGNGLAEYMAKEGVAIGRMCEGKKVATPAGIKYIFRTSRSRKWTAEWNRVEQSGPERI